MTLEDGLAFDVAGEAVLASDDLTGCPSTRLRDAELHLAIAKWLYASREGRPGSEIAGFYGEAAWDILLGLYLQEGASRRTDVSSACIMARVPSTTALRYVNRLCQDGWLVRTPAPGDRRRSWLDLSPLTHARLDNYLAGIAAGLYAIMPLLQRRSRLLDPLHSPGCLGELHFVAAQVSALIHRIEAETPQGEQS